jgi:putative FmdB family regulatory protein
MPMYEYVCAACGREFEELARMAARDKAECPHCGGTDTQRKFSVFAAQAAEGRSAAPQGGGGCGRCGQMGPCSGGGF